jgi:hypothetical protein
MARNRNRKEPKMNTKDTTKEQDTPEAPQNEPQDTPEAPPQDTPEDGADYIVATPQKRALRIRISPGGKDTLSRLKDGEAVHVTALDNGWAQIDSGWVKAEYLKEA